MFDSTYQAYSYAGGDPVNGWDPSGDSSQPTFVNATGSPLCGGSSMIGCSYATPPSLGCYNLEASIGNVLNSGANIATQNARIEMLGATFTSCNIATDRNLNGFFGSPNNSIAAKYVVGVVAAIGCDVVHSPILCGGFVTTTLSGFLNGFVLSGMNWVGSRTPSLSVSQWFAEYKRYMNSQGLC